MAEIVAPERNRFVLNGLAGEVRWVFHRAATVGPFRIIAEGGTFTLHGETTAVDAYRIRQSPLVFVVVRPKGPPWRFPILSLNVANRTISASLGPQE